MRKWDLLWLTVRRNTALVAGKGWKQEWEMSGHFAATVRKQRKENAGAHSLSFFLFSSAYGMVPPTVE